MNTQKSRTSKPHIIDFENSSMSKHLLTEIALGLMDFKFYDLNGEEVASFTDLLQLDGPANDRPRQPFLDDEPRPNLCVVLGIEDIIYPKKQKFDTEKFLEMQMTDMLEMSVKTLAKGDKTNPTNKESNDDKTFTLEELRTKDLDPPQRALKQNIEIDTQRHYRRICEKSKEALDLIKDTDRYTAVERDDLLREYNTLVRTLKRVLDDTETPNKKYKIIKTIEHARRDRK